jgi:hypothetical protein
VGGRQTAESEGKRAFSRSERDGQDESWHKKRKTFHRRPIKDLRAGNPGDRRRLCRGLSVCCPGSPTVHFHRYGPQGKRVLHSCRIRSRIYRCYSRLEAVDPDAHKEDLNQYSHKYLEELDRIEDKVTRISLPLAYVEDLYALRLHIDMLRKKLQAAKER